METRGKLKRVAAACLLSVGLSAAATARIIYVDDDAAGANNGSSWADAFVYLQDALAVAVAGDEIQVAQGLYRPDQGVGIRPGNQGAAFHLAAGIVLRGGYAGIAAADPDARNLQLYRTVLSGDCRGDDPEVQEADLLANLPSRADNSFHVVVIEQVDSCVLDGFVIRGGHASDGGGGLQIRSSSPTVWNCTFTQNYGPKGGAVFVPRLLALTLSDVSLHNCRFTVNSSIESGGALCTEEGVMYLGGEQERGRLLLTGCGFVDNLSTKGGAVSSALVDVSLSACTFRANRAHDGGGLHQLGGSLDMTGCTFVENSALSPQPTSFSQGRGGAMLVSISAPGHPAQAIMADCLFRNNQALYGGAIWGNPTTLRGCRFTGNVAYKRCGAVDHSGTLTADNCLFDGNQSLDATGVADGYLARFTNCTFVDNRSRDNSAFYASGSHGMVTSNVFANCIVWGMGHGLDPKKAWLAKTSVTYSNVEGDYPGAGNLDLDPQWADPGHWDSNRTDDPSDDFWVEGDCHLKSRAGRWDPAARVWAQDEVTSPCIDAGDPQSPVGEEPQPNGARINMGAYGGTAEASQSYLNQP